MPYIVAKDFYKTDSFALEIELGKELVTLKKELLNEVGYDRIQLITISGTSAYNEYAPYTIVKTKSEFKQCVQDMKNI